MNMNTQGIIDKDDDIFHMELCFICFMAGLLAMDILLGNYYLLGGV